MALHPTMYVRYACCCCSVITAEVKQLEEKGELEDGDPLNSFFKKIFAQGDEDTRRSAPRLCWQYSVVGIESTPLGSSSASRE